MDELETDMAWTKAFALLVVLLSACVSASRGGGSSERVGREAVPDKERVRPEAQPKTVCVVEQGKLVDLPVSHDPVRGDTLIDGQPFHVAHLDTPPMYAGRSDWFVRMDPIAFNGRRYPPYGTPRVLPRSLLTRIGDYRGTPLFVEKGSDTRVPVVLHVPIRPGCVFQTYMPVEN